MRKPDGYSRLLTSLAALLLTGAIAGCGGSGKDPILGTSAALIVAPVTGPVAGAPGGGTTGGGATGGGTTGGGTTGGGTTGVGTTGGGTTGGGTTGGGTTGGGTTGGTTGGGTTGSLPDQSLTVTSTVPASGDSGVCPSASINATFNIPSGLKLDPASVNALTFRVTTAALVPVAIVATTITVDTATGKIATFVPSVDLVPNVTYTATISGGAAGVKDVATPANTMALAKTWSFSVGPATGACLRPVPLNRVQRFGIFGGTAGMTNNGINTVITGAAGTTADIGTTATATSSITGFHDSPPSDVYTETGSDKGLVTGKILTCAVSTTGPTNTIPNPASCLAANNALLDAQVAYNTLAALPPGPNPDPGAGSLSGLTLAPGVYKAAAGSFTLQGSDLTLDAKGDVNAVFVFQMASSLTVGGPGAAFPRSIILAGGAQAKNVFWQVGSAATINAGGGGAMVGTIIAQSGVVISTVGSNLLTTLAGRALSLIASVTMNNTIITVPLP